jgi:pyruvate dehydrogenase E2 component (dihydrolipoamide acetyltransferase)
MAEIIRMPRLSDTMEEGNIVAWLKKEGDKVKSGDVLAEVETDKATMELESYFDGYLLYVGVPSGNVAVDGIIAIIGQKDEDWKSLLESQSSGSRVEKKEDPKVVEVKQTEIVFTEKVTESLIIEAPESSAPIAVDYEIRVKASPLAKSIALQSGINISEVTPSSEGGRIIKSDVENYLVNPPVKAVASPVINTPTTPALSAVSSVSYGDMPVTQMRKVIAKRLSESLFTAPHFYLTIEIDMENAISARNSINSDGGVKISFNDFVVKSCASALRKHPMINSSWMGDKIVVHENINIGVAVAVPDGLLVPVINHADQKSLSQINGEVKVLAGKAKDKKLQPLEMSGNTFTISNLGMFDIEQFTAIINTPDACILAVGSIVTKPVVKNGIIVVGNTMKVTLSCDHRVVDGATAAQFLQTLKTILENPVKMLV